MRTGRRSLQALWPGLRLRWEPLRSEGTSGIEKRLNGNLWCLRSGEAPTRKVGERSKGASATDAKPLAANLTLVESKLPHQNYIEDYELKLL
jgi:hypothetical protein